MENRKERNRKSDIEYLMTNDRIQKSVVVWQVMILLLGIISISYAVGSEIGIVSGAPPEYLPEGYKDNLNTFLNGLNQRGDGSRVWQGGDGNDYKAVSEGKNRWRITKVETASHYSQTVATTPVPTTISDGDDFGETTGMNLEDPDPDLDFDTNIDESDFGETTGMKLEDPDPDLDFDTNIDESMQIKEKKLLKNIQGPNALGQTEKSFFESDPELAGTISDSYTSYLLTGLVRAQVAKFATNFVAKSIGFKDEQAAVLGDAAGAGVMANYVTNALETWATDGTSAGRYGTWVGAAVALYYVYKNYEDLESDSVTFECTVWEAPRGGNNCELCNNEVFGCSEYQCKSLGKGCELLNPGTEEELCTWINRNDVEAPEIKPWNDALDTETYKYTPDNTISPPDRGVEIKLKSAADCIPAYTPLQFGVTLNEPATCKIDFVRKDSYEDMDFYFGSNSLAKYNHTHIMSIPSINATGTIAETGINLSIYTRCEDANGNNNLANFVFKFCTDESEDFTPPLIISTSVRNNQAVAYGIDNITMTSYINEQASCKWDYFDKAYDRMDNTMDCTRNSEVRNAQVVYPCDTNFIGIKDRVNNDFYIKCEDTNGNKNRESHKLTLIGTQELFIDWVKPEGIIKDSVSPVKVTLEVKTSSGYLDGNAFCYYKNNEITTADYVKFLYEPNDRMHQHSQDLTFNAGSYNYSIKCIDEGGNVDFEDIVFDVETDTNEPVVVRAYREDNYLKLITNEEGECVYNTALDIGCNYEFDDGIAMQNVGENEHFVDWNTQDTFYIKCKDIYDNPPNFQECSIVARPSEGETL